MRSFWESCERKCPVCGGKFFIPAYSQWAYKSDKKHGVKYYCSWKCMRAAQKEEKKGKKIVKTP